MHDGPAQCMGWPSCQVSTQCTHACAADGVGSPVCCDACRYKTMYRWMHRGCMTRKRRKSAIVWIADFLLFAWCRRDESNTRPSHYEFSPAGESELYRNNSDCKSLSPLKFPHSALKVGATQPPAKRSMSVPELCRADQRAVPAKSRGPPVPAATRDKARHSSFACFGAAKRDIGLISPRQIFSRSAH